MSAGMAEVIAAHTPHPGHGEYVVCANGCMDLAGRKDLEWSETHVADELTKAGYGKVRT